MLPGCHQWPGREKQSPTHHIRFLTCIHPGSMPVYTVLLSLCAFPHESIYYGLLNTSACPGHKSPGTGWRRRGLHVWRRSLWGDERRRGIVRPMRVKVPTLSFIRGHTEERKERSMELNGSHHLLSRGLEACAMDWRKGSKATSSRVALPRRSVLLRATPTVFFVMKRRTWQNSRSWIPILSWCRRNNKTMSHSHPPLVSWHFVPGMSFLPSCLRNSKPRCYITLTGTRKLRVSIFTNQGTVVYLL